MMASTSPSERPEVQGLRDLSAFESERRMRRIEKEALPANLYTLLSQAASEVPDRILLDFFEEENEKYSYRQVHEMVTALAKGLSRHGIGHGTHVAVMTYTGISYPVTWLALASLGAVTVPINYNYTSREVTYNYTNSEASHLIIHADFKPVLDEISSETIPRDKVITIGGGPSADTWETLIAESTGELVVPSTVALDDLCNIQYTSGTTGLPKGAMLSHRYWLTFGRAGASQIGDNVRSMIIAQPFYYVDAQWMFLMMVFMRGTAYLPRKQSSTRFLNWIKNYKVEFCSFPEIVSLQKEQPSDKDNNLKVIYAYSHRLENYRRHEQRYGCLARQGFAMTEIGFGMYVPLEADFMTGTGTVGLPSLHREAMIADPEGKPVPDGELGEICVRGAGILLGYWGNPKATAEAFHEGKWFRTGDLGRRDENGFFWYLGRLKDMVKRSGENVSATEVEAVIRGVAGVKEVAVVPVPDPSRGEEVKAYILLQEGLRAEQVPPETILEYCRKNLAKFKVPRYLEYVEEFPRTPSLKIKKIALLNAKGDLTVDSYDANTKIWLSASPASAI